MTDLRMKRGDDLRLNVGPVRRADDSGTQDITGYTLRFTAKERVADADSAAAIGPVLGVIDDGPGGIGHVIVPGASTDGFVDLRVLLWDLQISDPGGARKTLDSGKLIVEPDITRA